MIKAMRSKRVLPGFGLTLGFTIFYLSLIVLLPLSILFLKTATLSWNQFLEIVTSPRVLASYKLSFGTAFLAALVNAFLGLFVAWVLVRYRFLGKKIIDALIDLPFALPTAVAGIALTAVYAPSGWIGRFTEEIGLKIVFTPLGITLALVFIGFPFVVRTVQPVLEDLDQELEEAAATLGSSRWKTFTKIIFPQLFPAMITGFTLAFSRALGEYGSVVFISGNMPMKTEIAPLLIITRLEEFDYSGATAISAIMLLVSFSILFIINYFQAKTNKIHLIRG